MIIYQKETQEIDVPIGIKCDKCQKEYAIGRSLEPDEFLKINFVGGYYSEFGDGIRVRCDLCSSCLKELIGKFARLENTDKNR